MKSFTKNNHNQYFYLDDKIVRETAYTSNSLANLNEEMTRLNSDEGARLYYFDDYS